MTKKICLYPLALATTLAAPLGVHLAAAAPTIVNGSFEEPALAAGTITDARTIGVPGWTPATLGGEYLISGNVQDLSGNFYGTTPFGTQYLGLNGFRVGAPSVESQAAFGFVAGTTYAFTFYLANLDGASNPSVLLTLSAGIDGTGDILAQETFTAPRNEGPYGDGAIDFVPQTLFYTPTQDGDIAFSLQSVSNGVVGIDNVSLAIVPEPATITTTLLGAAALVGLTQARRRGTSPDRVSLQADRALWPGGKTTTWTSRAEASPFQRPERETPRMTQG